MPRHLKSLLIFSNTHHRYYLEQPSLIVLEMAYSPTDEAMTIRYINWRNQQVIFEYILRDTDSVFPFEIRAEEDYFLIRCDSRFKRNKNMGYFFFDGLKYHFFKSVKKLKQFQAQIR